jgi:nucleoside-diphosphate-sugar epimerase
MNVLVTGATGFVGQTLVRRLVLYEGHDVRCAIRKGRDGLEGATHVYVVGEVDASTDWQRALVDVDYVVHLTARVHVMRDHCYDPLMEFRRVNTDGTLNLARQAAAAGVRRFIFLSTIKVNGEATHYGCPFTPSDLPAPQDPYGISKHEAEVGLRAIAHETGMEVVIIRPTLVYGKGARGNFKSLIKLVARGLPLPLGSINNFRSFVGIDNLVDFIVTCLEHPAAANETFMVSDGEDISTPDLIRRMARAMNRPARLLPVPVWALQAGALFLGKGDAVQRLCGNLQVDISKSRTLLGWYPPISVNEGLRRAVSGD